MFPVKFNDLVIVPLLPKRIIRPIPIEMEGINIGNMKIVEKTDLSFMLVLCMHNANVNAKMTVITVLKIEETKEFFIAVPKLGESKTLRILSESIYANIRINGINTDEINIAESKILVVSALPNLGILIVFFVLTFEFSIFLYLL